MQDSLGLKSKTYISAIFESRADYISAIITDNLNYLGLLTSVGLLQCLPADKLFAMCNAKWEISAPTKIPTHPACN